MTMANLTEQINLLYSEASSSGNHSKMNLLDEIDNHLPKSENVEVPKVLYLSFQFTYDMILVSLTLDELGYEMDSIDDDFNVTATFQ